MSAATRMMNAITMPLLRSPLHGLVSRWCMAITVRGRKTGNLYTTPVYYQRDGQTLRFFTGKTLKWVSNLRGGAPVTVLLRGEHLPAVAVPCEDDPAAHAHWLRRMYPRMSAVDAETMLLVEVRL